MQLISGSVGEGGANRKCDVALVQAILVKTPRPLFRVPMKAPIGGPPYLTKCDGNCGTHTKDAIRAFQKDNSLSAVPASGALLPVPTFGVVRVKPGLVEPNDSTWEKLLEKVPTEFSDMRVLPQGKTVFLAGTAGDLHDSLSDAGSKTFETAFQRKVLICINNMYRQYGVVVGVCRKGDRRTFAVQDELLNGGTGVTNAGPGESNHNFGMAVDLGFEGLRWLRENGDIVTGEDSWMHKLDPHQTALGEALVFWEAMRAVGTTADVGMFRGPIKDRPHLQNWDDANVDVGRSLADLLARSGSMQWSVHYGNQHYRYRSDLGLGGDQVELGTASEIWNEKSTLTLALLDKARKSGAVAKKAAVPPAATADDLTAMKKKLRREFELADQNWSNWQPK